MGGESNPTIYLSGHIKTSGQKQLIFRPSRHQRSVKGQEIIMDLYRRRFMIEGRSKSETNVMPKDFGSKLGERFLTIVQD
jgi:hypothetical protein